MAEDRSEAICQCPFDGAKVVGQKEVGLKGSNLRPKAQKISERIALVDFHPQQDVGSVGGEARFASEIAVKRNDRVPIFRSECVSHGCHAQFASADTKGW